MTLTCEHVDTLLSSYFEGDLGGDERRAVDAHLRGCLRCTKIVRDVEAIRRDAANLPELAPSRDLWAGIAARIDTPVIDLPSRASRAPVRRTWHLAAAAVLLMAVSSGVTYLITTGGQRPSEQVVTAPTAPGSAPIAPATPNVVAPRRSSGSGSTVLISTEPMTAEVAYDQEIVRLRKILDERRRDLDPATVAAVEKSLRAIDGAIADAKAALASDASSVFLNEQLNKALEKKLGVLRRVALMPVGAS
jgi:putative zinc finger protein